MEEYVILVDKENNIMGLESKMQAHIYNKRHQAFSVFIFNDSGEMLLQCRADDKYHSAGKWSNACCSHPDIYRNIEEQAHERLRHEMGIDCPLEDCGLFAYEAELGDGMYENEIDRIYIGTCNDKPVLNPMEAKDFRYAPYKDIAEDITVNPDRYTEWFKMLAGKVYDRYEKIDSIEERR